MFHYETKPFWKRRVPVRLQFAERYLRRLCSLGDAKTSVLLPLDLANLEQILDSIELPGFDQPR